MSLDEELDGLYQAPLAEFIAQRNDLARRLRSAGDREAGDRVRQLAKPSLTAWVVNQLYFRARAELDALLAAGDELRQAHLADVEAHRAAAKVKREAVSKLLAIAAGLLEEQGTTLGRSHRQRVSRTLEALAGGVADAVPGRLTQDLEPAGFDALSGLSAALEKPPPAPEPAVFRTRPVAVVPRDADAEPAEVVDLGAERRARARQHARDAERRHERQRQQLAEARRTVTEGEGAVTSHEREAGEAEAALAAAQKAAAEAAAAAAETERRAREAREQARAAAEEVRRSRSRTEAAKVSLARARARLEEARRALARLADEGETS